MRSETWTHQFRKGRARNAYATLKVVAEMLGQHMLTLALYEDGNDHTIQVGERDYLPDGRFEDELLLIAGDPYEGRTPGDDGDLRVIDANQGLDALEKVDQLLEDHGLEVVMSNSGEFSFRLDVRAVALLDSIAPNYVPAMGNFERMVAPDEPDIEIDFDSLTRDEVAELLKDESITGMVRLQLQERLFGDT
jgi:hypothetical protein